jgi:glycosyltransferase involved in cell wall biosynthesis
MVTPRFLPYLGGVENHVYEVTRRLAALGVDVTVLTTDTTGELPSEEHLYGVTVYRVRAWPRERDYYLAPSIYSIITRGRWDLIHIQSYHTFVAPLAMLAALRAKIPYVVTFHGGGHSSRLRNAVRGLQRKSLGPLLTRAERLVAIAKFEIQQYSDELGLPKERFVFIPNGAEITVEERAPHKASERTIIASVGRLERYKGHHRIIAALPYILEHRRDIELWIAGSGPYEPHLRRLIQRLGLENYVRIQAIPADQRARMAEELAKTSLVALLSEYETHPIAALEALSLGRPVLATNTSGLRELAEAGLVHAIPPSSTPQEIAAEVLMQLDHPLIPGSIELPTWDACAQDLLKLYRQITGRLLCAY